MARILNTIGLIFGLVGVVIIFIWGPPQPSLEEGIGFALEDNTIINEQAETVKDYNSNLRKKRNRFNQLSRFGLLLIFIGFAFQLWGTWE